MQQKGIGDKFGKSFEMDSKMFAETFTRIDEKLQSIEMNLHAKLEKNLKIYLEEEICKEMNHQAFTQHVDRHFDSIKKSMGSFIRTGINGVQCIDTRLNGKENFEQTSKQEETENFEPPFTQEETEHLEQSFTKDNNEENEENFDENLTEIVNETFKEEDEFKDALEVLDATPSGKAPSGEQLRSAPDLAFTIAFSDENRAQYR